MTELYLHNSRINTVFDLLGCKENDITYSIGWALSRSPAFLSNLIAEILSKKAPGDLLSVRLQEYTKNGGFTDIQIETDKFLIIVEAKRGWALPEDSQLMKYADRLKKDRLKRQGILVVMSECSDHYAKKHLKSSVAGFPVRFIRWQRVVEIIDSSRPQGSNAEKRLLDQLRSYMEGVITMQNRFTNWVYVVSLGSDIPEWSDISWIDIVNKKLKYFYPFDHKSWPNEPPNYIAFRYYSKLQSIHHIEGYQVVEEMHSHIPEIKAGAWEPHFLFDLGKPFRPDHDVPTGPRIKRANRVWVLLDTLFTSDTISDALTETEKRKAQEDN